MKYLFAIAAIFTVLTGIALAIETASAGERHHHGGTCNAIKHPGCKPPDTDTPLPPIVPPAVIPPVVEPGPAQTTESVNVVHCTAWSSEPFACTAWNQVP